MVIRKPFLDGELPLMGWFHRHRRHSSSPLRTPASRSLRCLATFCNMVKEDSDRIPFCWSVQAEKCWERTTRQAAIPHSSKSFLLLARDQQRWTKWSWSFVFLDEKKKLLVLYYYTWATSESVYSEPRDSRESSERQAHAEACCLVHVGIFRHLDKHECKWTYNTLGKYIIWMFQDILRCSKMSKKIQKYMMPPKMLYDYIE
jgi:hypothetical protein